MRFPKIRYPRTSMNKLSTAPKKKSFGQFISVKGSHRNNSYLSYLSVPAPSTTFMKNFTWTGPDCEKCFSYVLVGSETALWLTVQGPLKSMILQKTSDLVVVIIL